MPYKIDKVDRVEGIWSRIIRPRFDYCLVHDQSSIGCHISDQLPSRAKSLPRDNDHNSAFTRYEALRSQYTIHVYLRQFQGHVGFRLNHRAKREKKSWWNVSSNHPERSSKIVNAGPPSIHTRVAQHTP